MTTNIIAESTLILDPMSPHEINLDLDVLRAAAVGTSYIPNARTPFYEEDDRPEYKSLRYASPSELEAQVEENARALWRIGVETLADPIITRDPDVAYCRRLLHLLVDELHAGGRIGIDGVDTLHSAFDEGVKRAVYALARAVLGERGSIPLPPREGIIGTVRLSDD